MRDRFVRWAFAAAFGLAMAACASSAGSCLYGTDAGYDVCEQFPGSDYNVSAAQNRCETGSGTYSSSDCPTAGSLGVCDVAAGSPQEVTYTYSLSGGDPSEVDIAAQSACGVEGGTFTSG